MLHLYISIGLLAFTGLFPKIIGLPITTITWVRCWIALLVLSAGAKFQQQPLNIRLKDWPYALLAGGLMTYHWVSFFYAIRVSSVALGLIAMFTYPMITALLEPLWDRSGFRRQELIQAIMVLVGIWVIIPHFSWANTATQGMVWGLSSALALAVRNLITRHRGAKYPPENWMLIQVGVGSIILCPSLVWIPFPPVWSDFFYLLILGGVITAFAHSLLVSALFKIRATTVGIISSMQPIYGGLLAWLILGEAPGVRLILGGTIIGVAVIWATLSNPSD